MANFNAIMALSLARRFMNEVLESVETVAGITETHGVQTLVDLMYLQNAIISNTHIDDTGYSKVTEILKSLPSAKAWMSYVRIQPQHVGGVYPATRGPNESIRFANRTCHH